MPCENSFDGVPGGQQRLHKNTLYNVVEHSLPLEYLVRTRVLNRWVTTYLVNILGETRMPIKRDERNIWKFYWLN